MVTVAELTILDLRCAACAEHIEQRLRALAGVAARTSTTSETGPGSSTTRLSLTMSAFEL